jgi:L-fuconolactonase
VQDEPDPQWLARPEVRRGLKAVADAGLPYDLLVRPTQAAAGLDAVRALPELTFVLDHLGKPPIATAALSSAEGAAWAAWIRELAAEPNVVCKLSGMVTEAHWETWTVADLRPYAEVALEAFGPDRLMFGSDWPVCLLAGDLHRGHRRRPRAHGRPERGRARGPVRRHRDARLPALVRVRAQAIAGEQDVGQGEQAAAGC